MSWLSDAIHHPAGLLPGGDNSPAAHWTTLRDTFETAMLPGTLNSHKSHGLFDAGPDLSAGSSFQRHFVPSGASNLELGQDAALDTGVKQWQRHPLSGVDPLSNSISNLILGRNDPAIVNAFGSPSNTTWEQSKAANPNIDFGRAKDFNKIGDAIAGFYGGGAALGPITGGGGGASGGVSTTGAGAGKAVGSGLGGTVAAGPTVVGAGAGATAGELLGAAGSGLGGSVAEGPTVTGAGAGAGATGDIGGLLGMVGSGLGGSVAEGPTVTAGNSGSFLPATGFADVGQLSGGLAGMLGISGGGESFPSGGLNIANATGDGSDAGLDPGTEGENTFDDGSTWPNANHGTGTQPSGNGIMSKLGGWGKDLTHWLSNPKNLTSTALTGLSLKNALSQPSLPGAGQTALNNAGPIADQAAGVIKSGGTSAPIWTQQKSSIDASIDQQIQQQAQALQQAAANSGMGNQNSGVVQQQLAQMKSNLEKERQQLYLQAQQQNVQAAISELTGANSVLDTIASLQMKQQFAAQQAAFQTAQLAARMFSSSGGGGGGSSSGDSSDTLDPANIGG